MRLIVIHILSFLILFSEQGKSQNSYNLQVEFTSTPNEFKSPKYKTRHSSETELKKEINQIYLSLINNGFIAASVDSIKKDTDSFKAYVTVGGNYKWANLICDKAEVALISKLGYGEKYFRNKPFKYTELYKLLDKIIVYYENNGYPFASAKLDSVSVNNNSLSANLVVIKNVFVKLDSIIVEGDVKINPKFLHKYLGIKNGMPYNESSFKSVSKKLKQLSFLTAKQAPVLRLTDKQNKLYLFLNKRNASQFDGIVGILPNDKGKTVFTGDVKIKLVNNILRNGETFDINWRRLQTQTQDLKASVIYPYLFGLPIGVDYGIKIYKKDSSFIDVNNSLGLNYYFSGLNHIKAFYKQRNSNLISTSGLTNITVLPEYADVITQAYGLGLFYENFDYKFNPKKGLSFSMQSSVGSRSIKKNPRVNDIAYKNILLKSSQYQLEAVFVSYLNLRKNHVLKFSSQFGSVFGNQVYKNELFRIGGLKTLRGFDEESIYASTFVIPTLEYRFLFEQNSNLFLFTEGAWYENQSINMSIDDTPISVGAGINFETKAGIFNLSYALGKQFNNGFDLRTGKIHAGLTALF